MTSVKEWDNDSWCVEGAPSGEELTWVATSVVDNMADRLRTSCEELSFPPDRGGIGYKE